MIDTSLAAGLPRNSSIMVSFEMLVSTLKEFRVCHQCHVNNSRMLVGWCLWIIREEVVVWSRQRLVEQAAQTRLKLTNRLVYVS